MSNNYELIIKLYDEIDPFLVLFATKEEFYQAWEFLSVVMQSKKAFELYNNGYINIIRGENIKRLSCKLPEDKILKNGSMIQCLH